jgi:hypothetical protein
MTLLQFAKSQAKKTLSPSAQETLRGLRDRYFPKTKRISAPENPTLVHSPTTYNGDGLLTVHNCDFLDEPRFRQAYAKGLEFLPDGPNRTDIRWRAHMCCWAATRALQLDGDFVECGVWYGILSRTIAEYTSFAAQKRNFYLVDTFGALETPGLEQYDRDVYDLVQRRFSGFPNVHLVRGKVPDILPSIPSARIAYLSIDMNGVEPERAALRYFYDKVVPGGVIYLDDYGWRGFEAQKAMMDGFFADKPEKILQTPSGQGVVVKL